MDGGVSSLRRGDPGSLLSGLIFLSGVMGLSFGFTLGFALAVGVVSSVASEPGSRTGGVRLPCGLISRSGVMALSWGTRRMAVGRLTGVLFFMGSTSSPLPLSSSSLLSNMEIRFVVGAMELVSGRSRLLAPLRLLTLVLRRATGRHGTGVLALGLGEAEREAARVAAMYEGLFVS